MRNGGVTDIIDSRNLTEDFYEDIDDLVEQEVDSFKEFDEQTKIDVYKDMVTTEYLSSWDPFNQRMSSLTRYGDPYPVILDLCYELEGLNDDLKHMRNVDAKIDEMIMRLEMIKRKVKDRSFW
jgi:hypothetical protein